MPANAGNRISTSDSLKTHDVWQKSVGYDPYAGENEDAGTIIPEVGEINSSAKGLFRLAQLTGNSSTLAPGACKRCGQVGHLYFNCRNFMMGQKRDAQTALREEEEDPASDDLDSGASDDDDDDDSSDSSDSDSDDPDSDAEDDSSDESSDSPKKKKRKKSSKKDKKDKKSKTKKKDKKKSKKDKNKSKKEKDKKDKKKKKKKEKKKK